MRRITVRGAMMVAASPFVLAMTLGSAAAQTAPQAQVPDAVATSADQVAAPTQADQKKVAEEMQKRAFETVPYVPTAQFIIPTAYRTNLSGVIISPVTFIWNVEKK